MSVAELADSAHWLANSSRLASAMADVAANATASAMANATLAAAYDDMRYPIRDWRLHVVMAVLMLCSCIPMVWLYVSWIDPSVLLGCCRAWRVCTTDICTRKTLAPVARRACRELLACGRAPDSLLPFTRFVECQDATALAGAVDPRVPLVLVALIRSYLDTAPKQLTMTIASGSRVGFAQVFLDAHMHWSLRTYHYRLENVPDCLVFESAHWLLKVHVPPIAHSATTLQFGELECAAIFRLFAELDAGVRGGPAYHSVCNHIIFGPSRLQAAARRILYGATQTRLHHDTERHKLHLHAVALDGD